MDRTLVKFDYWDWHDHISKKSAIYLDAVDLESKISRIEDLQKSLDHLREQVEDELLRLANQVPG
jgi:hypothetical protein